MPTVSNQNLTLTTENNSETTLTVTFDIEFNEVERNLVSLGVDWHPHIDIIGYDGPSGEAELFRDAFPHTRLAVTAGSGSQTLRNKSYSTTKLRSELQEDTNGDDEIKCNIRMHAGGLPEVFAEPVATSDKTLAG
jgi:hypothetical protein